MRCICCGKEIDETKIYPRKYKLLRTEAERDDFEARNRNLTRALHYVDSHGRERVGLRLVAKGGSTTAGDGSFKYSGEIPEKTLLEELGNALHRDFDIDKALARWNLRRVIKHLVEHGLIQKGSWRGQDDTYAVTKLGSETSEYWRERELCRRTIGVLRLVRKGLLSIREENLTNWHLVPEEVHLAEKDLRPTNNERRGRHT